MRRFSARLSLLFSHVSLLIGLSLGEGKRGRRKRQTGVLLPSERFRRSRTAEPCGPKPPELRALPEFLVLCRAVRDALLQRGHEVHHRREALCLLLFRRCFTLFLAVDELLHPSLVFVVELLR